MKQYIYRIAQSLRTVLPEVAVARTIRATGLVEQSGDIDSVPFFWNFLFGSTHPDGSVTKVNDFYDTSTVHDAAYLSIQQWVTPEIKRLLLQTVAHLSVEVGIANMTLAGDLIDSVMSSSRIRPIAHRLFR